MKNVSILGSTGSIGTQALEIVRLHPTLFKVCALAAGSNVDLLEKQVREFGPSVVCTANEETEKELRRRLKDYLRPVRIGHSKEGLERAATLEEADIVLSGLPGSTGLVPTFAAVNAGKDVALATKEVLVMAGQLFMDAVRQRGIALLPVDSEQSAIFQCLRGNSGSSVKKIILTASGGPFRDMPPAEMAKVRREQALHHPRWKMGPKVTVDSATLMNKGLEVIEARWLFDVPVSQIEVVIHPESICHSMVEFDDGSILGQLGATDMRIPISYALAFPQRITSGVSPISFPQLGALTFHAPDWEKFPLLRAAYDAAERGGSAAVALNAADEVAVELFLAEKINFGQIARIVFACLDKAPSARLDTLSQIMDLHERVVRMVRKDWRDYDKRRYASI
jgi:1-deoxy-D-xylulose-5-phosphate reductoisomerase